MAAAKDFRALRSRKLFEDAVTAYASSAKDLKASGRRVSSSALQRRSGLTAFSKNANRNRAIAQIVGRYE